MLGETEDLRIAIVGDAVEMSFLKTKTDEDVEERGRPLAGDVDVWFYRAQKRENVIRIDLSGLNVRKFGVGRICGRFIVETEHMWLLGVEGFVEPEPQCRQRRESKSRTRELDGRDGHVLDRSPDHLYHEPSSL